jgi:hypothetical protein
MHLSFDPAILLLLEVDDSEKLKDMHLCKETLYSSICISKKYKTKERIRRQPKCPTAERLVE